MTTIRAPLKFEVQASEPGREGQALISRGVGKALLWSHRKHMEVEHHTATDTLSRRESGSLHTNLGATGTIVLNLPTDSVAGDYFWVHVLAAQAIQVEPGSGGAHYINGAKQTDGKYITSSTINDWVLVVADGNLDWIVFEGGTWTVEP